MLPCGLWQLVHLENAVDADAHVGRRCSVSVLAPEGRHGACEWRAVNRHLGDLVSRRHVRAVLLDEAAAVELAGRDAVGVHCSLLDAVHDVGRHGAGVTARAQTVHAVGLEQVGADGRVSPVAAGARRCRQRVAAVRARVGGRRRGPRGQRDGGQNDDHGREPDELELTNSLHRFPSSASMKERLRPSSLLIRRRNRYLVHVSIWLFPMPTAYILSLEWAIPAASRSWPTASRAVRRSRRNDCERPLTACQVASGGVRQRSLRAVAVHPAPMALVSPSVCRLELAYRSASAFRWRWRRAAACR